MGEKEKILLVKMSNRKLKLINRTTSRRSVFGFLRGVKGHRVGNLFELKVEFCQNPQPYKFVKSPNEPESVMSVNVYDRLGVLDTLRWFLLFSESALRKTLNQQAS